MRQVLQTDAQIEGVIDYLLLTGGKMLRPRLVHLAASLAPHDEEIVQDVAVAVELIHLASLIHDDVIDNSFTRRGRESLNSIWGNQISVLTGDYLFATSFHLINRHNLPLIMENITETIQIMCSGEIKQLSMLYDYNISEKDYYDKTYRKTACLFASSCKVGALAANMPLYDVSILEQYGLCLGYAYQIIDDILDFSSDTSLLGKTTGHDLAQGNITLPVILALKKPQMGKILRELLESYQVNKDLYPQILKVLWESNAIEEALSKAKVYLQSGLDIISEFSPSPVQKKLQDLGLYIIENYYKNSIENIPAEDLEWKMQLN